MLVSKLGQLGVVSGTALDSLFVRRLGDGDPGGHMRRGLDAFPFPEMAQRIWEEYYIPGGKAANALIRCRRCTSAAICARWSSCAL
jgi:nitronate monooxygenase